MQITITIKTDNAAFEDNPNELSEILAKLAERAKPGDSLYDGQPIFDINGARAGFITIKEEV